MDLITTHINADFDALASMVAASKLYPQARLIFSGSQERNVREFLAETRYPLLTEKMKKLDFEAVTCLILVDAKRASRIGPLKELLKKEGLEVHIYDHHPAHPKDIAGKVEVLKEVGATSTIFVGLLRERKIPFNPMEATILALGIYEETGFLTFSSTTEEDFHAAAYLLSQGANLSMVSDFIRRELTAEQVSLLNELITQSESYVINGIPVVISTASLEKYVGDLALLTHKLRDMENINVLFTLVRMDNRIHMVARSRLDAVDAGEIAQEFGGGGHPTAASATIKDLTLYEAKEKLLHLLKEKVQPLRYARDIMTTPVKIISEEFTIGGASEIMNRFGITTLPVVQGPELVGLIRREVVDKALYHGLEGAPVKEYMSTELQTVNPDTPLPKVQRLMMERGLGFLPVVERRRLKGAITRADLLRYYYEDMLRRPTFLQEEEREGGQPLTRNLSNYIANRLPPKIQALLRLAGEVADQVVTNCYIVGGFVRDLLLGVENFDVDLVVEGDGIAYAEALASHLQARVRSHKKFGTAVLTLPDGFKVDVASARTEYYEHPAALPTVEHSSIRRDLYRRDFTINTLAIKLNRKPFGELIDFFGGQRDLRDKVIRVIHSLSFVDDPTRALRAARFEARYGFRLAKHTVELIQNAVALGLFQKLSGKRLSTELSLIFQEGHPVQILKRLEEFRILEAIHPKIHLRKEAIGLFERIREVLSWHSLLFRRAQPQTWQIYLLALLSDLHPAEARAVIRKLSLSPKVAEKLGRDLSGYRSLSRELSRRPQLSPSQVYRLLMDHSLEILLFLMAKAPEEAVKRHISDFLTHYSKVTTALRGDDLMRMGIKPGPIYRDILNSLLYARLDGKIQTREGEVSLVKKAFAAYLPS
ncbi:MAG: CBS domain-containing protein [candidate division NC10 bacterium]|nr:CBS domain-containing protein [candidate division NC10 bacterium]